MTEEEISIERTYRYEERLGMLCGSNPPSVQDVILARREANEWEANYRSGSTRFRLITPMCEGICPPTPNEKSTPTEPFR